MVQGHLPPGQCIAGRRTRDLPVTSIIAEDFASPLHVIKTTSLYVSLSSILYVVLSHPCLTVNAWHVESFYTVNHISPKLI